MDRDVLRSEHTRELFALRRLERTTEAEVRLLDRRLRKLGERHDHTARWLESEYRRTHFGKSAVSWPTRHDDSRLATQAGALADARPRRPRDPRLMTHPPHTSTVVEGIPAAPKQPRGRRWAPSGDT